MKTFRFAAGLLVGFLLSACNVWEKDNTPQPTPLANLKPLIRPQQVWDKRVSYSLNHNHLKLNPSLTDSTVVTTDPNGTITVVDKASGRTLWKPVAPGAITTSAGAKDDLIVVGAKNGQVFAFSPSRKGEIWRTSVHSEILASPVICDNIVLIKSVDGKLTAFSGTDGHYIWSHQEQEPSLILRGSSTPQVTPQGSSVIVGYANGKVVKILLHTGHEIWGQSIATPNGAFAIQRMIDIEANPVISGNEVFAVTYQGKVAALDLGNGRVLWDHDTSAYSGLAVDGSRVYVSDAQGNVLALDRHNGRELWRQTQLQARDLTGPALVGNYVVVADAEGAMHWLSKDNGAFMGRVILNRSGVRANPVSEDHRIYTLTQDGYLFAYALNS